MAKGDCADFHEPEAPSACSRNLIFTVPVLAWMMRIGRKIVEWCSIPMSPGWIWVCGTSRTNSEFSRITLQTDPGLPTEVELGED